jgi:hypothetical protein
MTTARDVTLVVVPREHFQMTRRSLGNIYDTTTFPFALIYVNGGSPATTRRYLKVRRAREGSGWSRPSRTLSLGSALS